MVNIALIRCDEYETRRAGPRHMDAPGNFSKGALKRVFYNILNIFYTRLYILFKTLIFTQIGRRLQNFFGYNLLLLFTMNVY